jgi:hypothetical protein
VINGNKIIGGTPSPRRQGRHGRQVRSARRDPPIGEFTHNAVTELSLTVLGHVAGFSSTSWAQPVVAFDLV